MKGYKRMIWVSFSTYMGKAINLDGFKAAMGKSWRCSSFSLQKIDDVFYQAFFGTQETLDFVLSHGPQNFDNNLVLV